MEAVLHDREANKGESGRPPALPAGAHLLLTLEFWREYQPWLLPGTRSFVYQAGSGKFVVDRGS